MENWIDNITYGNPTDDHLKYLDASDFDIFIEQLLSNPFPANSSEAVKDEIRVLIEYQKSDEQKDSKLLSRYLYYDNDVAKVFKAYCKTKIGQDMDENIDSLMSLIMPVLIKLKYKYQRPRPYQLAEYYKARLFPFNSKASSTPSYPCGHTFIAKVLTELIGNTFTDHYQIMVNMTHDIAVSRLFLGLNYPSDNDFAHICAKKITTSKEFNTKYGL